MFLKAKNTRPTLETEWSKMSNRST